MDDWEKLNEATLPEKEEFYSNLEMGEITDVDYVHGKRVCKDFKIKHSSKYHDLYLRSDTLLLVDVFENFRKMYLKIYQLDPAKCLLCSGLAWKAALKKTEVKLEILFDVNGWAMSENLPGNKFEQIEETSQFNEDFIKNCSEESDEEYFPEVDVQ